MKMKVWLECSHDGPVMVDETGYDLFINDIEKLLGIDDMVSDDRTFPVWIDTDDFNSSNCRLENKE